MEQKYNLKNLINLSTDSNINIFNKKKNKLIIKDKKRILKECENIKKKEVKISSNMLSNLAKLNKIDDSGSISEICNNLKIKINKIDKVIDCVKKLEEDFNIHIVDISPINESNNELDINNKKESEKEIIKLNLNDKYLECYSNY